MRATAACGLRQFLLALAARARVLLDHRHRVAALEPTVEVDVGAALRTERAKALERGLAADRAAPGRAGGGLIHGRHVGVAAVKWKPAA
jgi:hypothetical protein